MCMAKATYICGKRDTYMTILSFVTVMCVGCEDVSDSQLCRMWECIFDIEGKMWQKRPMCIAKETYINCRNEMHLWYPRTHICDISQILKVKVKVKDLSADIHRKGKDCKRDQYVWLERPIWIANAKCREMHLYNRRKNVCNILWNSESERALCRHTQEKQIWHKRPVCMAKETYMNCKREMHLCNRWGKMCSILKETNFSADIHKSWCCCVSMHMAKETCLYGKSDVYVWQNRFTSVAKETHMYGQKNCIYGHRDLCVWQNRSICVAKEIYMYSKRDMYVWQKRPISMAKETYMYGKRDVCV